MQDEAAKRGWQLVYTDAAGSAAKQVADVRSMIAQKVDAIIVNPVDTDATPKITKMVTDAEIPLVYVNRKPVDFDKLPAGSPVKAIAVVDGEHLESQEFPAPTQAQGTDRGRPVVELLKIRAHFRLSSRSML